MNLKDIHSFAHILLHVKLFIDKILKLLNYLIRTTKSSMKIYTEVYFTVMIASTS